MAFVADRVQESSSTIGTGILTLLGASAGFQSFTAAFGNGVSVYYVIAGGSEFEVGIGTTGAGTLSRDTVLRSTNANALVVLSPGVKEVFCAYVADRAVTTSDAATLTNKTMSGASNTLSSIGNASLTNSAVSVNGVSIALGASGTVVDATKLPLAGGTLTGVLTGATDVGNIIPFYFANQTAFPSATTYHGAIAHSHADGKMFQAHGGVWNALANESGNVATATALQTGRTINGVSFDGTANITVTAATANALTLGSGLTGTSFTGGAPITATVDATDASTASKVVSRNASGSSAFQTVRLDGSTSGTVTVQGAAAAGTWSLTLPTTGGTAGYALTTNGAGVANWSQIGAPLDAVITPSLAIPYDITTSDVGKRLLMNSTSQGAVQFLSSYTSAMAVGSQVKLASMTAITALIADGQLDQTTPGPVNNAVRKIAQQSDGKLIIVGDFTSVGGTTRNYIARLNSDGTLDTAYNPNANGLVDSVALQSDGKAVVVGNFTTIGGTVRNYICRINTDGTLDATFDPNASGRTLAVAVQSSDQKVLVGGTFVTMGGTSRLRLARLNTNGTLDTGYNPAPDQTVRVIVVQPADGKAIIAGDFTTIASTIRNRVARINAAGTLDTAFADPNVNATVHDLAVQSDGKYVIVGAFTSAVGTTRNRCARLTAIGTLDTGFNPNCNATAQAVAIDPIGKIYIGGTFSVVNSIGRNKLTRLNTDGTVDASINPNVNGDVVPGGLTLTADRLYVGGNYTTVSTLAYAYFARLFVQTVDVVTAPNVLLTAAEAGYNITNVPRFGVLTFEKMASGQWLVTECNFL